MVNKLKQSIVNRGFCLDKTVICFGAFLWTSFSAFGVFSHSHIIAVCAFWYLLTCTVSSPPGCSQSLIRYSFVMCQDIGKKPWQVGFQFICCCCETNITGFVGFLICLCEDYTAGVLTFPLVTYHSLVLVSIIRGTIKKRSCRPPPLVGPLCAQE